MKNLNCKELRNIRTFFFVPVGLPGMGKTTLSKNFRSACQKYFFSQVDDQENTDPNLGKNQYPYGPLLLDFQKVSYDGLLKKHQQEYLAKHPDEEFHRVIDIIRDFADQEYLDIITEKNQLKAGKDNVRNLVYLDRNNTADIWESITSTIRSSGRENSQIIALMPCMGEFNPSTYKIQNPLSPEFVFECIKRIYGRKEHSCLSASNKPKVIDVLVKFTKLYDGADLNNEEFLRQYFD